MISIPQNPLTPEISLVPTSWRYLETLNFWIGLGTPIHGFSPTVQIASIHPEEDGTFTLKCLGRKEKTGNAWVTLCKGVFTTPGQAKGYFEASREEWLDECSLLGEGFHPSAH